MVSPEVSPKNLPKWFVPAVSIALLANTFVLLVVNYFIYWARAEFIATHPEYVAKHPPTISRALSDPLIGEPFAFWISLSSVILFFGVVVITALFVFAAREIQAVSPKTARFMRICAVLAVLLQIGGSTGMVILSQYRMGFNNDMHMVGSYLFFFAQGFVVLTGLVLSLRLLKDEAVHSVLRKSGLLNMPAMQLRVIVGWISVVVAVSYLVLFVIKDIDFPVGNEVIYQAYVWTEPAVISSFLVFLTIFHVDFITLLRRRRALGNAARPKATVTSNA